MLSKVDKEGRIMDLWEILVPASIHGRKVKRSHHKTWDANVRNIASGLTILKPVKGQWLDDGEVMAEKVIPVRIVCSINQITQIAEMTAKHYQQKAVMFYKLSRDVFIQHFQESSNAH